jgi:hypothetical protein
MRINAAGNIGINTSSPTAKLDVNNQDAADTFPLVLSNSISGIDAASSGIGFNAHGVRFAQIVGGQQTSGTFADGNLRFSTRNAETVAERMRITSAGDVGIGTNSPQSLLDVKNGSTYSSSGTWLARVQQNTNGSGQNGLSVMNAWAASSSTIFEAAMGWNGAAAGYYPVFTIDGLGQVIFRPERTEAMRITNTGNVGIGATSLNYRLEVQGGRAQFTPSSENYAVGIRYNTSTDVVWLGSPAASTLGVYSAGGGELMRVRSNGSTSYSGQQLVQNYYQTGSITPTSTKWWRICTLPATNQTQYVEFLLTNPGAHLIMKVKFSKSTAGGFAGGGVLDVEQLGSYVYWNYYPFDWRLVDAGTNSASHIDIRFPHNASEPFAYRLQVLDSWSAETTAHATFPFSDQGTGTTGSYYANMGNNTAGWTKQSFKMTGGRYAFYDNTLTLSSGQTPPTA